MVVYKICSKCKTEKSLDEFYASKYTKDKREAVCKECGQIQRQQWREKYPEKYKERQNKIREWKKLNREKCNEYSRNAYKRNPERAKKATRRWEKNHPKRLKEMRKELYRKNADKINKRRSILLKANPQYYINRKLKITEKDRLNARMSASIRESLHGNKNGWRWEEMVGYIVKDLKRHLEKQFKPNMSWENMGKWHIDHIVPISVFNFKKSEDIDFKKCWALSNLQPLWAKENIAKHNKLVKPFQPAFVF